MVALVVVVIVTVVAIPWMFQALQSAEGGDFGRSKNVSIYALRHELGVRQRFVAVPAPSVLRSNFLVHAASQCNSALSNPSERFIPMRLLSCFDRSFGLDDAMTLLHPTTTKTLGFHPFIALPLVSLPSEFVDSNETYEKDRTILLSPVEDPEPHCRSQQLCSPPMLECGLVRCEPGHGLIPAVGGGSCVTRHVCYLAIVLQVRPGFQRRFRAE